MSLGILLPSGQYNPDKLIDLGGNRWSFRPAVGVSRAVGKWIFEAAAIAWLFTDNDDCFGAGFDSYAMAYQVMWGGGSRL